MRLLPPDPRLSPAEYAEHLAELEFYPPWGRFVLVCQKCGQGISGPAVVDREAEPAKWYHAECRVPRRADDDLKAKTRFGWYVGE
jgi:hypothetical protein